jgi:hypothetical protein
MFVRAELERVLLLQEKTYALLKWLNASLRENRRLFGPVHEAMSLFDAGKEWIRAHYDQLPHDARPEPGELDEFAHLFTSYLATSFEVAEKVRVTDGCGCAYCTYFYDARYVRPRNPTKKARAEALELKRNYLRSLGAEKALNDKALAQDVSMACYAHELLRRSKFAGQGEGVLVLWREIAWDASGRPNKKFKLTADAILKAEARLLQRV